MTEFSVIVPVYNRPDELNELMKSLSRQSARNFEVIVIEDGSIRNSDHVVTSYASMLDLRYVRKDNSGQGFSRNFGAKLAKGDWLVFFDSDCVIPSDYFRELSGLVETTDVQAFCGPDAADPTFSTLQKAISYSMTSFLTTGGIRGSHKTIDRTRHLRSYNMSVRSDVFRQLNGFAKTNMGEDMEFSNRFLKEGFQCIISQKLVVYHKRRNTLLSFFRQVYSFGQTRIQLKRDYHIAIKPAHLFPFAFLCFLLGLPFIGIILGPVVAVVAYWAAALYSLGIVMDSTFRNKSLKVGMVSWGTSFIQLAGYGLGFAAELLFGRKQVQPEAE